MKKEGYVTNVSQDRFLKLCKNPQTGVYDEKSIFEAKGALQLETEGIISNLRRPNNRKVDLDFKAELAD